MGKPYSLDLRECIVGYVAAEHACRAAGRARRRQYGLCRITAREGTFLSNRKVVPPAGSASWRSI